MKIEIPNNEILEIDNLLIDLNGTISIDGKIIDGVKERFSQIKKNGIKIYILSGDTNNTLNSLSLELGVEGILTTSSLDKRDFAIKLGAEKCAAIGNGLIDLELLRVCRLGIITIQAEGASTKALLEADLVVTNILDGLEFFINYKRLVSCLRK